MDCSAFKRLNFDHYGALFSRAVGAGYLLAVCTAEGKSLWHSDPAAAQRISEVLGPNRALLALAVPAGEGGRQSFDPKDGKGRLFWHPVDASDGKVPAWLVALEAAAGEDEGESGGAGVAGALSDIARCIGQEFDLNVELDGMAEELSLRYEELNLIYSVGTLAKSYRWQDEDIFRHLLKPCTDFLDFDLAVIFQPDGQRTVYTVNAKGRISDLDLTLTRIFSDISQYILSSKKPVIINALSDPRRAYLCHGMEHKILAAPVLVEDQVRAILVMVRHQSQADFFNGDRKLLTVLSCQTGNLIHGQDMYSEMQVFTEQVVSSLVETVDAKDPYTRGHSERVNVRSMQIGSQLNLDDRMLRDLYWASLLHDLGKIGVPDVVLTKSARLDEDEFILVEMHPLRGSEILRHVKRLEPALPGILHHHEKFDGSGYPHGLKGANIPLHARIIAVADTYDAMTSSRAYRAALSHPEAMDELQRVAGFQLDPEIVEAWSQVVIEHPEICSGN